MNNRGKKRAVKEDREKITLPNRRVITPFVYTTGVGINSFHLYGLRRHWSMIIADFLDVAVHDFHWLALIRVIKELKKLPVVKLFPDDNERSYVLSVEGFEFIADLTRCRDALQRVSTGG